MLHLSSFQVKISGVPSVQMSPSQLPFAEREREIQLHSVGGQAATQSSSCESLMINFSGGGGASWTSFVVLLTIECNAHQMSSCEMSHYLNESTSDIARSPC